MTDDRVPDPPYPRAEPPAVLYHAVKADEVETVLREGVFPTGRPHVHLARRADHARHAMKDEESAVVFRVNAAAMHAAGHAFFVSPKTRWLTHTIPPEYLVLVEDGE